MNWPEFSTDFIQAMVQAGYLYEARQYGNLDLLTDNELHDFYRAYCGI